MDKNYEDIIFEIEHLMDQLNNIKTVNLPKENSVAFKILASLIKHITINIEGALILLKQDKGVAVAPIIRTIFEYSYETIWVLSDKDRFNRLMKDMNTETDLMNKRFSQIDGIAYKSEEQISILLNSYANMPDMKQILEDCGIPEDYKLYIYLCQFTHTSGTIITRYLDENLTSPPTHSLDEYEIASRMLAILGHVFEKVISKYYIWLDSYTCR